jgi:hypothetical protein
VFFNLFIILRPQMKKRTAEDKVRRTYRGKSQIYDGEDLPDDYFISIQTEPVFDVGPFKDPEQVVESVHWSDQIEIMKQADELTNVMYEQALKKLKEDDIGCNVCGKQATLQCGGKCGGSTHYCGSACQRIDWVTHRLDNLCAK